MFTSVTSIFIKDMKDIKPHETIAVNIGADLCTQKSQAIMI